MNKKILAVIAAILVCAGAYFITQSNVDDGSNMKKEFTEIRDKGNPLANEQQLKTDKKVKEPPSDNTSDEFKKIRDKGNPLSGKK